MKTPKLLALALCASLLTGCITSTNPDGTITKRADCGRIAHAVEVSTPLLVAAVVAKNPETRDSFALGAAALDAALALGVTKPSEVADLIRQRVSDPLAVNAIISGIAIYDLLLADVTITNAARVPCLIESMSALARGLNAGLR